MNVLGAFVLLLLILPHIALGIAWITWGRAPSKFQTSKVRTALLFSGLLGCLLNIAIFWLHVIWMNVHRTDPSLWILRHKAEEVCNFLNVFAILAGVLGQVEDGCRF
jgi:hypothetical protein